MASNGRPWTLLVAGFLAGALFAVTLDSNALFSRAGPLPDWWLAVVACGVALAYFGAGRLVVRVPAAVGLVAAVAAAGYGTAYGVTVLIDRVAQAFFAWPHM